VWSIDLARGFETRLTSHPANDYAPLWSPDGTQVIFSSDRDGPDAALYRRAASGVGVEELILGTGGDKRPNDWSRDGKYLLYVSAGNKGLWVLPMVGERRPEQWSLDGPALDRHGRFSPDAHWIAYDSSQSGAPQVYVRRFPGTSQVWRISTNGGFAPEWRADGKELFFLDTDGTMMAAPLKSDTGFEAGPPAPLFDTPLKGRAAGQTSARSIYAVSADGQRFLFTQGGDQGNSAPITVVLNWTAALKK
jgi:Tol biopolymer transport system component